MQFVWQCRLSSRSYKLKSQPANPGRKQPDEDGDGNGDGDGRLQDANVK